VERARTHGHHLRGQASELPVAIGHPWPKGGEKENALVTMRFVETRARVQWNRTTCCKVMCDNARRVARHAL
jgi:hypothetical protein